MKLALAYDTETSGLPLFNDPSEDPRQPHIVQLGARLVDLDSRDIIATLDVIIRPDGWVIPDEVAAVHGITTERAKAVGISESIAIGTLLELWAMADVRIAHNESFDASIVRIAQHRFDCAGLDAWKEGAAECTAKLATPIMKLPPTPKMVAARRNHPKTPNLREAVQFFTGRPLLNAHSALADVDGCLAVYWAIQDGVRQAVEPLAA
jgi:DNA polymerase III subunit epsilon